MSKGQDKSLDELFDEAVANPDPLRRPAPGVSEELPTKAPGKFHKDKPKKLAEIREDDYTRASKHGSTVAGSEELRAGQGRRREAPRVEAEPESPTLPNQIPSAPIDLAAAEFAGSAALAQEGVQYLTQHAADPVHVGGLKALVTLLSSIEPVIEMFRRPLLQYSRERPDFIPALVSILDRLRANLVDMSPRPPTANQQVGEESTIEEAVKTMQSTYYTPIKASELLNLSDRTIRDHCESGTIRAVRVGRDWFISPQAIEEFARNPPRPGPKPRYGSSL